MVSRVGLMRFLCLVIVAIAVVAAGCLNDRGSVGSAPMRSWSFLRDRHRTSAVTSLLLNRQERAKAHTRTQKSFSPCELTRALTIVDEVPPLEEFTIRHGNSTEGEPVVSIERSHECTLGRYLAWHMATVKLDQGGPVSIRCQARLVPRDGNEDDLDSLAELLVWEDPSGAFAGHCILTLERSDSVVLGTSTNRTMAHEVLLDRNWRTLVVSFLPQRADATLGVRLSLPNGLEGTLELRNLTLERPSLLTHFAEHWPVRNSEADGVEQLHRSVVHMGQYRDCLVMSEATTIDLPVDRFDADRLEIDYAWAQTGYRLEVQAILSFVESDRTTELWSALSCAQRPGSFGSPHVNESWRHATKTIPNHVRGRRGVLRCEVRTVHSEPPGRHRSRRAGSIRGNAVLLLGEALCYVSDEWRPKDRSPHVVVLSVDSLSPEALPGGSREEHYTTPHVAELMRRGTTSDVCLASSGMTYLTLPSMLTSRYPHRNGVVHYGAQLHPHLPSIGSVLHDRGYRVVQFATEYILRPVWQPSRTGFPVSRFRHDKREAENDFLAFLDEDHDRPVFAYFHQDTRYQSIDVGGWDGVEHIWQRKYRQLVVHADALVGQVMALVDDLRKKRPTILVVTADHGEDIQGAPLIWSHCHLYDSCLRIPFIVDFPDVVAPGFRFDRQTRAIDIVPTILGLIGVTSPAEFDGDDLADLFRGVVPPTAPPAALALFATWNGDYIYALRQPPWKYLHNPSDRPTRWYPVPGFVYKKEELYEIVVDPDETTNVADRHPDVCATLQMKLRSCIDAATASGGIGKGLLTGLMRDGYLDRRTAAPTDPR